MARFSRGKSKNLSANLGERACVVLDIQMQGLTGFDLQKELASRGIRIPVIVASAQDDAKTWERARELGAAAFFRKPVDGEALIDTIHWIMGGEQTQICSLSFLIPDVRTDEEVGLMRDKAVTFKGRGYEDDTRRQRFS